MYCHISRQIDDYIDQQYRLEREDERFNHLVEEKMRTECKPSIPDNFLEWFGEINDAHSSMMSALLEIEEDEMLGRYIRENITSYWESKARELVIKEMRKPVLRRLPCTAGIKN